MDKKYVVSQQFIDALAKWQELNHLGPDEPEFRVRFGSPLLNIPPIVQSWQKQNSKEENNNRLMAIIHWLDGDDVFEVI